MLVVLVVALVIGVTQSNEPPTNAERLTTIAKTIRCPFCSGESVAESDSAVSQEIRLDIAKRLQAGQTDNQIRGALADQYGEFVLLNPAPTGVTSIVWILPVVVLVVAIAGLAAAFRRWRLGSDVHATAADRELVGRALAGEDTASALRTDDPEMGGGRWRPPAPGRSKAGRAPRRVGDDEAGAPASGEGRGHRTQSTRTAPASAGQVIERGSPPTSWRSARGAARFLLTSLRDLEAEHDVGDVDERLRAAEGRLHRAPSRIIRSIDSHHRLVSPCPGPRGAAGSWWWARCWRWRSSPVLVARSA
jgi:cytochrome c-type biogenesis protein CcmH/NrfF